MSDLAERDAKREAELEAAIRRYGHVSFTEKTPHRELVGEANKLHGYRKTLLHLIDAERAKNAGLRAVIRRLTQEDVAMFDAALHASMTVVHDGELAPEDSQAKPARDGETR